MALQQRMRYSLGSTVTALGLDGGSTALAGFDAAAPIATVVSGLEMAAIVTAHAASEFTRRL